MAERPLGWPGTAALLLLAAALSILAQGFALPSGINAYHWPELFGWIGSPEGPSDPFIDSLQYFVTFFWPALGLVVDEANAPWLLPLVHLALRFLVSLALYLIFDRLQPGRRCAALLLAAVLPVGLAFYVESPLGHGEVLLDNLSHSSANPPVALFIIFCAMTRRWIAAGVLLGLLFNINAFVAAWLGGATALGFCLSERASFGAALRRQGLPALLLAVAIALPTAWRIYETLGATAPILPDYDFRDFLREFYAGHFFPGATGAGGWLLFLLLLAGLAWLAASLAATLPKPPLDAWRGLALGLFAVVLFGIALPTLSGSRLLLNAHPLRLDFLLVWLFYLGLGLWSLGRARLDAWVAAAWLALFGGFFVLLAVLLPLAASEDRARRPGLAFWLLLLAAAFALLGSLPQPAFGPPRLARGLELLLLLPALAFACRGEALRDWAPWLGLLAGLSLVPLPAWWTAIALLLPLPWLLRPTADRRLLAALAIAVAAIAAYQARSEPLLALLLLASAIGPLAIDLLSRWRAPPVLLDRRLAALCLVLAALAATVPGLRHLVATGRLDHYDDAALDFLELQRWARQETPVGSDFLVPESQLRPNLVPSFWTESRRSAWVDWRMGAGAHWLPDFYWLWHQRMGEVTALGDTAAKLAYAQAHGIDYVILEEPPAARPDVVYANAHYTVLRAAP